MSYKQQALFSLASLPFSFKLLWAPIVDSTSFWGLGRRKAWLLPVQFLCGMMMLLASPLVGSWVGEGGPEETPDVQVRGGKGKREGEGGGGKQGSREALQCLAEHRSLIPESLFLSPPPFFPQLLTVYFFVLYALMATQDIAVDGWALTMLSRENVGLGTFRLALLSSLPPLSTVSPRSLPPPQPPRATPSGRHWVRETSTAGFGSRMTIHPIFTFPSLPPALALLPSGYFLAHVGFLALNSAETCNRFLRRVPLEVGT